MLLCASPILILIYLCCWYLFIFFVDFPLVIWMSVDARERECLDEFSYEC